MIVLLLCKKYILQHPKVIYKSPTVIFTQQNMSHHYKISIILIQETLCKVNLDLKWFEME